MSDHINNLIERLESVGSIVHIMSLDGWAGLSKNPDWLCGVAGPVFTSDKVQVVLCPDAIDHDSLSPAVVDALVYVTEAFSMNGHDTELAYDQLLDDLPAAFKALTTWQADCAVGRLEELSQGAT